MDLNHGLDFIDSLKPKSFKFIDGTSGRTHMGFLAQDVKVVVDAVTAPEEDLSVFIDTSIKEQKKKDADPEYELAENMPLGFRYHELMAPMVKAIQELKSQVEALTATVAALT